MPHISKDTIEKLLGELDIVKVIERDVTLKRKGANMVGSCPFHSERTSSFTVSPTKGIYKCFGCGKAGGGINFVMAAKNLTYPEAIKDLCDFFKIDIEYLNLSKEEEKEYAREEKERANIQAAIDWANAWFISNTIDNKEFKDFLKRRDIPQELADLFMLGYAPDSWDALLNEATKQGFSLEVLEKASLITKSTKKDGKYFDYFRNRVTFPIQSFTGKVVAFSARDFNLQENKDIPKYLNSRDSSYNKSKEMFGLFIASKHIREAQAVYSVEGPTDVIQMVRRGILNTVAACGTSFTEGHAKQIKRIQEEKIIGLTDPDKAGEKSLHRTAEIALKAGFKFDCLVLTKSDGDPGEAFAKANTPKKVEALKARTVDYLIEYLLGIYKDAEGNPADDAQNCETLFAKLQLMPSESRRKAYHSDMCQKWKKYKSICGKFLADTSAKAKDLADKLKVEEYTQLDELGFYVPKNAHGTVNEYWVKNEKSQNVRISNFTMNMIFYINTGKDSYYILELRNVHNRNRVVKAHTKEIATRAAFNNLINNLHGSFEFTGTDTNLSRLREHMRADVPLAVEPTYLGWNEKFDSYVWSNGVYYGEEFLKADKYGIVRIPIPIKSIEEFMAMREGTQIKVEDVLYVIPPPADFIEQHGEENISEMIKEEQIKRYLCIYIQHGASYSFSTTGGNDDAKDLMRMFKHFDKGEYAFEDWARLMVEVYGENGMVGVMYYVASLFRDIIYKSNNNWFPLLAPYGKPQSGKSTMARSLGRMYGDTLADGIHLGKGGSTVTGFKRAAAAIVNGIIWLNEFKNTLEEDRIQAIKSLADGSGKVMGEKTSGNETKNYEPQSAAIVGGQDLPTADPALLERIIPLKFEEQGRNYKAFDALINGVEEKHLTTSVTCGLLKFRKAFENYNDIRLEVTEEAKKLVSERYKLKLDDRLAKNISTILAPYKCLSAVGVSFPFTYDALATVMVDIINKQIAFRNTADDVAQFLNILISLLGKEIHEGEHFKIESTTDKEGKPIKGFFLRLGAVTNHYREKANKIPGTSTLTDSTLGEYLKSHPWFVAYHPKNIHFEGLTSSTSAYVLNYEMMMESGLIFAKAKRGYAHQSLEDKLKDEKLFNTGSASTIEPPQPPNNDELPF